MRLHTAESKYNDEEDLKDRMIDIKSKDEIIWSSLQHITLLKTQIKLNIETEQREKLSLFEELVKGLLC
ncbi:hypothetical protein AB204_00145 [Xenorhabdus khoisanae]|uniref:Uncharacterized protein n=1 Tax=Xenorhabdus khoisanae TaxID=880157 RepID=A0A0J5FYV2_9GAMM|nr:hypothetical protein [Xenorhabdus khoisanae]KMJ47092.1 hypothetical protein AB204_00145 [Xenorhabdus khoisanae]